MAQFFDPIRAFFVRSKLENLWDLDQYPLLKCEHRAPLHWNAKSADSWRNTAIRSKFHSSFSIFSSSSGTGGSSAALGKDAWQDRVDAEKTVDRWLSEFPSTFITITGPPGSGKASLVSRVLGTQQKWVLSLSSPTRLIRRKTLFDYRLLGGWKGQDRRSDVG